MVGAMGGLLSVTMIIAIFCQKHGFANHGKKLPKNGTEGRANRMAEYIEREALERSLNERVESLRRMYGNYDAFTDGFDECIGRVEEFPAADVAPVRHGRWDECDWVKYDGHGECIHYPKAAWRCSNCCNAFKKELLWKDNYCPNCGAKMDLEGGDGNG